MVHCTPHPSSSVTVECASGESRTQLRDGDEARRRSPANKPRIRWYVQQLIVNNFRRPRYVLFGCCRTWQNNGTTSAGSLPGLLPVPPQHRKVAVPHRHGLWRTQTAHEHPTDLHRPRLDDQLETSCTEHTCVTLRAPRDEQGVTVRHHISSRENATRFDTSYFHLQKCYLVRTPQPSALGRRPTLPPL